jgi:hypothetical protein
MSDIRHSRNEWDDALEAAESYDWCPTDSAEGHGPLAAWICVDVIDREEVGRDRLRIDAAFAVLAENGEDEFSPERLIDVIKSWCGETVDDWRTLAEEYAEENGKELVFLNGTPTQDDYHQWFIDHGIASGETCVALPEGGTFYWFNLDKW